MSQGSALNVRELLRLIAEQQATLGKLQQLVVEHVLSESRPDSTTGSLTVAPCCPDLPADDSRALANAMRLLRETGVRGARHLRGDLSEVRAQTVKHITD